jgi:site-specific DNA-methyltransferase (adenine-specific)
MTLNSSNYNSASCEWGTPISLFTRLDAEFAFDLDVCATSQNAKCRRYFTVKEDGLTQEWSGNIWMNPPYGRGIDKWVAKAASSHVMCVCLLPVRSDTRWWHAYVMRATEIRLLTRRLSFEGSTNKAPFPSAVVVFKPGVYSPIRLTSMRV